MVIIRTIARNLHFPLGKGLPEGMRADDRGFFHEKFTALAQDLDDLALGGTPVEGEDARDRLHAVRSALGAVGGDKNVVGKFPVVGMQHPARAFAAEGADDLLVAAFQNGEHLAFVAHPAALPKGEDGILVVCAAQ